MTLKRSKVLRHSTAKKAKTEERRAERLLAAARAALVHAYAPKSGVHVGAAVEMEGGKIFAGANIEIGMNELGVCAERAALYKAVSEGFRRVHAAGVVVRGDCPATPCGVCREALHKFAASPDIPVFVFALTGGARARYTLNELLPHLRCEKKPPAIPRQAGKKRT